ncbi:MAG: methyltransferase family protein [Terriglobales bacterium]
MSPLSERARRWSALLRTALYASTFLFFVAIYVPWFQLRPAGAVLDPERFSIAQWAGVPIALAGFLLALYCAWAFAFHGLGTPAPFDPPRKLVIRGPYRWVRNPMYVGMGAFLAGQALTFPAPWRHATFYYLLGVMVAVSLFVLFYEEPTLRRLFRAEYAEYCRKTPRWLPRPLRPQ